MSFCILSLLVAVLLSSGNCEHEHNHNHHSDADWPNLLSRIEFLWKSTTTPIPSNELLESDNKEHHGNSHKATEVSTEFSTTVNSTILQNGTFVETVKDTFRASLALLVGVPIVGVVFLCCLCYCLCKCCSICCEDEEKGQVIVMQQNNAPAPVAQPPPQIIVHQQPVYQTPYAMQPPPQWSPTPQQQFAAHAAYDNPNYGAPSAPPQYRQKY